MKSVLCCFLVIILLSFPSCIVQAPKFTTVEKVLTLNLGQSQEEVSSILGIPPYNFILKNDTETVLTYKFRVKDRTTLPFLLRETNGKQVRGKYVNLMVTYDKHLKVKKLSGCNDCDPTNVQEHKIDFTKLVNVLTVTLPVVAVLLGIKIGAK